MVTEFTKGKNQKFVATISFSLNWDDRDIKSIKIKEGQELFYDGEVATVENGAGQVKGRCMGLKSAINVMNWLVPVENGGSSKTPEVPKIVSDSLFENDDYKPGIGGNLDTYIERTNEIGGKREIIKEEDLIVKTVSPINKREEQPKKGKLEIAGDQVEVPKDRLLVSSTTIRTKSSKRDVTITRADEMGADSVQPLKKVKGTTAKKEKKKSFTVDDTTPRQIHEDMKLDEIHRITKVVNADESQDAKVVKKIDRSKVEVKEIEGVTLKRTDSPKDVKFNKTTSPTEVSIKTTVGSGSNYSAGDQGGVVVGRSKVAKTGVEKKGQDLIDDIFEEAPVITEEEKQKQAKKLAERTKKAQERAASRKKSSKETQKMMEKEKEVQNVEVEIPADKAPDLIEEVKADDLTKITSVEIDGDLTEITSVKEDTVDYLLMLPDNWNKLHWVKKEKFIKEVTDASFIRFILSMEITKAVRNACLERLEELGQKESG